MSKKFSLFWKNITVEPAYCLYTAVFVIVDSTVTNLLLQKKCRYNCTSEPDLRTPCDDEKQGVLFVSEINSYYRLAMYSLCALYAIFAVSWSDVVGRRRRPMIFLPIIGLIVQSLLGCLHTYYWNWNARAAALSNVAFDVVSGGIPLMFAACMTYICDVTDKKSRMMGLGLLSASRCFGDLVGYGSSGFILRSVGFFNTFLICAVLSLVAFLLAFVLVKDVSVPVKKKSHFYQIFSLLRIFQSAKVVYNKSLGRNRIVISMLFVIHTLVFFTTQGEISLQYLFLRYKFHWNEQDYSSYVIYRQTGVILGNVFCSVILSKVLQIHDGLIGIFAGSWDTIAAFGYLFASQDWHLYIIPIFDIFHGAALAASSAFYSKYYTSDEFGQLYSFLGLFGLLITSCYPAYNEIFRRTLDVFPSAYFILSIILDLVIVLLYWKSYSLSKKFKKSKLPVKEMIPIMAAT